jgi:ribosomal protein L14
MADNSGATTSKVGQIQTNTGVKVTASAPKATTSSVKEADVKQKSGGSSLADFLLHLDDYTPTVLNQ